MTYILITVGIINWNSMGSYLGKSTTVTYQEFSSKERCEDALLRVRSFGIVASSCVPK